LGDVEGNNRDQKAAEPRTANARNTSTKRNDIWSTKTKNDDEGGLHNYSAILAEFKTVRKLE